MVALETHHWIIIICIVILVFGSIIFSLGYSNNTFTNIFALIELFFLALAGIIYYKN